MRWGLHLIPLPFLPTAQSSLAFHFPSKSNESLALFSIAIGHWWSSSPQQQPHYSGKTLHAPLTVAQVAFGKQLRNLQCLWCICVIIRKVAASTVQGVPHTQKYISDLCGLLLRRLSFIHFLSFLVGLPIVPKKNPLPIYEVA